MKSQVLFALTFVVEAVGERAASQSSFGWASKDFGHLRTGGVQEITVLGNKQRDSPKLS